MGKLKLFQNISNEISPVSFETLEKYREEFQEILKQLDVETIQNLESVTEFTKIYLLENFLQQKVTINENAEILYFCIGDVRLFNLSELEIRVFYIYEYKNKIKIKGNYHSLCDNFDVVLRYNGQIIMPKVHLSETIYRRPRFLQENIFDLKVFEFEFLFTEKGFVEILIQTENGRIASPSVFHGLYSPFHKAAGNKIKVCENITVKLFESNIFSVEKNNIFQIQRYVDTLKNGALKKLFSFFLTHYSEYLNRRIWIFSDRSAVAGDNGLALYNYAKNIDDGIEKYFIIGDAAQLKEKYPDDDNIITFDSVRTHMLIAFSEKWISSIPWPDFYPKRFYATPFFFAFNNTQFVFLQHGIIKDDVSRTYNELRYNFSMFVTTIKKEYEYVSTPLFGYPDGVVRLTGLPRLDDRIFKTKPEKVITFAPTWRRSLSPRNKIEKDVFIKTPYYFSIMDFLSDEKLINALENNGFKLILKLHPDMQKYIEYFPQVSENIIYAQLDLSYSEIYEKSCLFITDWSSSVFDFAYSKKPIIYYQRDDNHHKDGYFSYENDGFGEIIKDTSKLVDKVVKIIEKGTLPKMSLKYQKRVDDFFEHTDTNNCKRTYDEIVKSTLSHIRQV
ncbi:hypothetical protein FACS1894132_10230 [Clostridia bacterium]|nr:hypothetical protein FACS1894132_10230 [Clostridia bacterium]